MAKPTITAVLTFSTGPGFGAAAPLGSTAGSFQMGINVLGSTPTTTADVSSLVDTCTITRGRNLTSDVFQTGTLTLRIIDQNGNFNPANASGTYYGKLNPGVKVTISATYSGTTYPLFTGYVNSYDYVIPQNIDDSMNYTTITATDGLGLFNLAKITTVAGSTAGDYTGTAIGRILDQIAWPAGMRTISTGLTTVQADPGTSRTSLNAMRCLESTENGAFYIDPSGYVVFLNKTEAGSVSSTGTIFKDDGTNVGYFDAVWRLDNTLVVNHAAITRVGGTMQEYTDTASVNKYFTQSITETDLLMQDDATALANATYYVTARAETSVRCDALVLDIYTDQSTQTIAALSLDFFDPLTITTSQPGGTTISKTEQVLGVQHKITPNSWKTTLTTAAPMVAVPTTFTLDFGGMDVLNQTPLG